MRFRHHTTPERASVRQRNDAAMGTTEAAVFRAALPGEDTAFPSGITVGDSTEPPAQVEGVLASAGLRTILIEWDRIDGLYTVDGAGGYEVELDIVNTFTSPRLQRTAATLASFTDLDPGTTYYVRVRAVQAGANAGDWSTTASSATALADTGDIQAGAVTADKIAANAVSAAKLASITMEVGKYIQSDNFDGTGGGAGDSTQGWRIDADGSIEANDGIFRGAVSAESFGARGGSTNLTPDGDFELGLGGWSETNVDTAVSLSSVNPHAGTYHLRAARTGGEAEVLGFRSGIFEVAEGAALNVSLFIEVASISPSSTALPTLNLMIEWFDESVVSLGFSEPEPLTLQPLDGDYREYPAEVAFPTAPGAKHGRLVFAEVADASTDLTIDVDDVVVTTAAYLEGAFASAPAAPAVQVVRHDSIAFLREDGNLVDMDEHPRIVASSNGDSIPKLGLYSGNPVGKTGAYIEVASETGVGSSQPRINLFAGELVVAEAELSGGLTADIYGDVNIQTGGLKIGSVGTRADKVRWGTYSGTTDANGYVTFAHGLGASPNLFLATPISPYTGVNIPDTLIAANQDATNMVVRCINQSGAVIASQSVSFYWYAAVNG